MAEIVLTPPDGDEVEISLFGPGYGECVVVHLGDGNWLINDSCVEAGVDRRSPVALRYLEALGISPADSVRLVVASHWHDDHVRGLAEVVKACPQAIFVCSAALRSSEFIQLVRVADENPSSFGSGVSEFKKVIDFRRQLAGEMAKYAVADLPLWRNQKSGAVVYSLAPSSESVTASHLDIAGLVEEVAENRLRVPPLAPNAASVVVWVDFGNIQLLLGGDLENHSNPLRGWRGIVSSTTRPDGKADVYKVAHHGSSTAHLNAIWTELLGDANVAIIAPWRRGGATLPTLQDLNRVASLSAETYVTSGDDPTKPRQRSRLVMETMRSATRSWRSLDPTTGHVQLRRRPGEDWKVGLSKSAFAYTFVPDLPG